MPSGKRIRLKNHQKRSDFEQFFPINGKPNRSGVDQIVDQYNSDSIQVVKDLLKLPAVKELYMKYNTLLPSSASVERQCREHFHEKQDKDD